MPTITLNFSVADATRIGEALERGQLTAIDEVTGDFLPATNADAKNFIMSRLVAFVKDSERQAVRDAANLTIRQHMDTDIPVDIT